MRILRNWLAGFILPLLMSCNSHQKPAHILPANSDIDSVVQAVIREDKVIFRLDSRNVSDTLYTFSDFTDPISTQLRYVIVINDIRPKGDSTVILYPTYEATTFSTLFMFRENGRKIFTTADTSYLFFQVKHLKKYTVSFLDSTKYHLIPQSLKDFRNKHRPHSFYDLSIPLFTKDKKYCYIELNFNCSFNCGHGSYYVLHKMNGKWTVIDTGGTWIS